MKKSNKHKAYIEKARMREIKSHFKEYIQLNKPRYCPTYGNKYKGEVKIDHFIFYAFIRGKNLNSVTHSIDSEKYMVALSILEKVSLLVEKEEYDTFLVREHGSSICKAFSITMVEFHEIMKSF